MSRATTPEAVRAFRQYSDTLLVFLLKAHRPEKFRDSYPGFGQQPWADREETLKSIQGKLARLAAQNGNLAIL